MSMRMRWYPVHVKANRTRGGTQPTSQKRRRTGDHPTTAKAVNYEEVGSSDSQTDDEKEQNRMEINKLLQFFNVDRFNKGKLRLKALAQCKDVKALDAVHKRRLIGNIKGMVRTICTTMMPNDGNGLYMEFVNSEVQNDDTELLKTILEMQEALPERSVQRQVLLAPICKVYKGDFVSKAMGIGKKKLLVSCRKSAVSLLAGNELVKPTRHSTNYKIEVVEFVLSANQIQTPSFGTKSHVVDGVQYVLPRFARKKLKECMHRDYMEATADDEILSYGSLHKIFQSLMDYDQRARKAVDYSAGVLLYDNLDRLRDVVGSCIDAGKRTKGLVVCEALEYFMKYEWDVHFAIEHTFVDCLDKPRSETNSTHCSTCQLPFKFLHVIAKMVHSDHSVILEHTSERVKLYMGHRVRVLNQRKRIEYCCRLVTEEIEIWIVMDYKMKFEALYYREKTTDHYGKKGQSWRGLMIYRKKRLSGDMEVVYFDQISTGDSKQDWVAVSSLVEVVIAQLKEKMPEVTTVNVQSDNAKCYQNGMILLSMLRISKKYGYILKRYIHIETQDGKGLIDAHFATAMRLVTCYINQGNNIISPNDVFSALLSNGGLMNNSVNLFTLDREKFAVFIDEYTEAFEFFQGIGRINEATLEGNLISLYQYSDVGTPVIVDISEISHPKVVSGNVHVDNVTDETLEEDEIDEEIDPNEEDIDSAAQQTCVDEDGGFPVQDDAIGYASDDALEDKTLELTGCAFSSSYVNDRTRNP